MSNFLTSPELTPEAFILTRGRIVCEVCFCKSELIDRVHLRKLLWYPEAVEEKCDICKGKLICP